MLPAVMMAHGSLGTFSLLSKRMIIGWHITGSNKRLRLSHISEGYVRLSNIA